jgi:uncharacterized phiE125 gp8 family phage protein
MAAFVVTRPTTEPVSLSEARAHLRLDTSDTDAMLAGYIIAARQFAEGYTRRVFLSQTWDVTYDYEWPSRIEFPLAPLISVSQVTYTDPDNIVRTLSPTLYLVRGAGHDALPYIDPAHEATWPEVLAIPESIRVRFVAGYGTNPGDVPEPIRTAILFHVELLYDRNPQAKPLLESARDTMLDQYRVTRL